MLSGIATSNTAGNGSRSSPIAMNTAASRTSPTRSRLLISGIIIRKTTEISRPTAAQDTPARMRRNASISPKLRIERRQDRHDDDGRTEQPGKGRDAAGNAAKARSEHHRQVDDVRARQKMAEREGFVELVRRHPAVLLDDAAPRKDQHAAEARERHLGERDEQREQAGRRSMSGVPAPEWRPAANPGAWSRFRTAAWQGQPNFGVFRLKLGRLSRRNAP